MKKELKALILAVGDEVTSGRVINSNASFLSQTLDKIGITTVKMVAVPDDKLAIKNEVEFFIKSDIDLLVTTGGLGPTHDDFTKEVVFETMGIKLEKREEAVELLNKYFRGNYVECNLKQTYYPIDATLLPNDLGTAMGAVGTWNGKIVSILVGPPKELIPMVNNYLVPYLSKLTDSVYLTKEFIVMGTGESKVEELLKDYYKETNPYVTTNPYFSLGKIRYLIKAKKTDSDKFNEAVEAFKRIMKEFIVTDNPSLEIEDLVLEKLKKNNYHISFSESCTGGMLASKLINTSGASAVINESFVTYADSAKIFTLGVNPETIKKYDVVSREVVEEMALGLQNKTKCEVCVSVSGYAGPTGGTDKTPVGTVWYAIRINDKTYSYCDYFKTSRNVLREKVTMNIFYHLFKLL